MVRDGALGPIRLVQVEYAQDWLAESTEEAANKQTEWRTGPARSGAGGCIGDIGTRAFNLADFVIGLDLVELGADLATCVPGRRLDENAQVMMRYAGGACGVLRASQVASGNENQIRLRIYETRGGLDWNQRQADRLIWSQLAARARSSPATAQWPTPRTVAPPVCQGATPKVILKLLPTSTSMLRRRSGPHAPACLSRLTSWSRPSRTARTVSLSSTPLSGRPNREHGPPDEWRKSKHPNLNRTFRFRPV